MKNVIFSISLRYLMNNKRRGIATIVGVIVAVSMILSCLILSDMTRQFFIEDAKENYGSWSVAIKNANAELLQELAKEDIKAGHIRNFGTVDNINIQGRNHKDIHIIASDKFGQKMINVNISNGRNIENEGEVIISKSLLYDGDIDNILNKNILIPIDSLHHKGTYDERSFRNYKVVGIFNHTNTEIVREQETIILPASFIQKDLSEKEVWTLTTYEKYRNTENIIREREKKDKIEKIENIDLMGYVDYNSINFGLPINIMTGGLLGIITLFGFLLVYNSFSILFNERKKSYSVLETIGATGTQKMMIGFYQGLIVSVITIPLGIIIGNIGINIVLKILNTYIKVPLIPSKFFAIKPQISVEILMLTVILSVIMIIVSALIPNYLNRDNNIVKSIKNEYILKRARKLGIIGLFIRNKKYIHYLAIRNFKNYKKSYRMTTFSIIVTILIFTIISSFISYNETILSKSLESAKEFSIHISSDYGNSLENIKKEIDSMKESKQVSYVRRFYTYDTEDSFDLGYSITMLDDESFKKFVDKNGIANELLFNDNERFALASSNITYYDNDSSEKKAIKSKHNIYEIKIGKNQNIKILSYINKFPRGISEMDGTKNILISASAGKNIEYLGYGKSAKEEIFIKSKEAYKVYEKINNMIDNNENIQIVNLQKERDEAKGLLFAMRLFFYGFIILLGTMTVANIFNTTSSNIDMRKKEFMILSTAGMNLKDIEKMIVLENIIISIRACIYGLLASILTLYVQYSIFNIRNIDIYTPVLMKSLLVSANVVIVFFIICNYAIHRLKSKSKNGDLSLMREGLV